MNLKSYTNIEQSKKLAEILPLESADMYYQYVLPKSDRIKHNPEIGNPIDALEWYNKGYTHFGKEPLSLKEYCVPCWSLAALLDVLPVENNLHVYLTENGIEYRIETLYAGNSKSYHNSIDACFNMILKLHELKML